MFYNYL